MESRDSGKKKGWNWKEIAKTVKRELQVYRRVLADPRTPWYAKIVLGLAIGYLMMPFDLIPDWLPVIGQLDDLLIIPGLVWLALKLIPSVIVSQARQEVSTAENKTPVKE
jgi:uncharacterized membrane protein YkvA (DUF1232 family)